jgi:hypothetical protein
MKRRRYSTQSALAVTAMLLATALTPRIAAGQQTVRGTRDWSAVDKAFGRKGAAQPGGVMKYSFPRSDLQVTANGVRLKPALALGGWVALEDIGGGHAMAMGDLVLTEDEVGRVMRALQQGGVEETALHNHVLHESPRVMYMHIAAQGDPVKIAQAIHSALEQSKTPLATPAAAAAPATPLELDTAALVRALGATGIVSGGVYQVSVPRRETIREHGHEIPPSMGVATGINFQPTGGEKAAITGDFVMRASEVNAVIRALQQSGIEVTALHSHMLDESPRLFFMHFWANDDAVKLAQGLRSALDKMAVKRAAAR